MVYRRFRVAAVLTTAVLLGGVTRAFAQDYRDVPRRGMVAVGGAFGVAPPADGSFTNGLDLSANAETYLSRRTSIRVQLNGAFWDITGRGFSGTVRPLAIDVNGVYNFEMGRIHPFVTGGVGMYDYRFAEHPTTGSTDKIGLDVGGGLEYFVHRRTTATVEVLYHDVAGTVTSPVTVYNDSSYWTFTVGLKHYFRDR